VDRFSGPLFGDIRKSGPGNRARPSLFFRHLLAVGTAGTAGTAFGSIEGAQVENAAANTLHGPADRVAFSILAGQHAPLVKSLV
jgi:hypothetical protein